MEKSLSRHNGARIGCESQGGRPLRKYQHAAPASEFRAYSRAMLVFWYALIGVASIND